MSKDDKKQSIPDQKWTLMQGIRNDSLYKSNIQRRDKVSRKFIAEDCEKIKKDKKLIIPGQLIMFDYFEPKTKDELLYYDAMPCTIFFGVWETKNGPRVIGFNMHYYPPRVRFLLMDRIYQIFKPLYRKSWNKPLETPLTYIDYHMLIEQLQKYKLDFGVRMYDPKLIGNIILIPPRDYSKSVFTEGRFKKRTRDAIMNYWTNWKTPKKTLKFNKK